MSGLIGSVSGNPQNVGLGGPLPSTPGAPAQAPPMPVSKGGGVVPAGGLPPSPAPAATGQQAPTPARQPLPPVHPSQQGMKQDLMMYVSKGLDIISSPQTRASIVTMLKHGDPVSALANTLLIIVQKLDCASRAKGVEIADAVKLYGAHDLLAELLKVMSAAGIAHLTPDQQNLAFSVMVQDYIKAEVAAGRINPAKLQQQSEAAAAQVSPKMRQQAQESAQRIQATAVAYQKGLSRQQPSQQPGAQQGAQQ